MNNKKIDFSDCPITKTAEVLGGKWSLPIIFSLLKETKRFKELERQIEGINTRMLVKELKQLENNGIVVRKVYPEIPPKSRIFSYRKRKSSKKCID